MEPEMGEDSPARPLSLGARGIGVVRAMRPPPLPQKRPQHLSPWLRNVPYQAAVWLSLSQLCPDTSLPASSGVVHSPRPQ